MTNNDLLIKYLPFMNEMFSKWKVNEDCQQMIFLDFLSYDNEKLNKLDESEQMNFGLVRFIKNYWFSKTSRYYYTYIKPNEHLEQLDTREETIDEGD